MNKIALIVDSAVDLDKGLRDEFNVADYVHGIVIRPDGSQFFADDDWSEKEQEEYFSSMARGKKLYKSATCSQGEAEEVFSKHLQAGEDILAISIGSAFSGMFNLFNSVAKRLAPTYPKQKIIVVDSARYSGAYGLLVVRASQLIKEGKTIEEVAKALDEEKLSIHQMGPLDDLFFLNRSGRVTKTIAVMGTMVGIRPLADFQPNGFCQPIGKVKGMNKALETAAEYVAMTIKDPKDSIVIVAHSFRKKEAEAFIGLLEDKVGPKRIILTSVGQISGASIGPGLIAAFYFGKPISQGCIEEKAVLDNIIKGQ